ncbi:MAG: nitrous oxide reductase family maturation protein NosD [Promethearchaeota archaeon]
MRKKNNTRLIIIVLGTFLALSAISNLNLVDVQVYNDVTIEHHDNVPIRKAGYWDLTGNPIFIDGDATGVGAHNWTWVENQVWFGGGNGTSGNPYIIENLTINGQLSGSCIFVRDSNKYFKIRNCTVFNAGNGGFDAGIRLENTRNGILVNNNCSFNLRNGIVLYNSCENNNISGNAANNNGDYGIILYNSCENNNISGNNANDNNDIGIVLNWYCDDNTITGNNVSNIMTLNQDTGIYLEAGCDDNTFSRNNIINNTNWGVYMVVVQNNYNLFYLNTFIGNGQNAFNAGVNQWDNGTIGNYWDDYAGFDLNGDGIGETPYLFDALAQDNYPIWYFDDNIDPIIAIITPTPSDLFGVVAPDFDISIDEYSLNTTWYTIDEGATNITFTGLTGTINQTAWNARPNGTIAIKFYANDTSSNIGEEEIMVRKDTIAPNIVIITPTLNQGFKDSSPNFVLSIEEGNLNTTWYTIDGGATNITFTGLTGTINQALWTPLSEGPVTLGFYANDTLGRIGYAEITVYKDFFVPIIEIHNPKFNDFFDQYVPIYNISVNETNFHSAWYTIDGGATNISFVDFIGTINQDIWFTAPNGLVTIRFYARDAVGNVAYKDVIVIKDTSAFQLYVEISEHSYSLEHFNLTFFVFDETIQGTDSATIQMWWNGVDVSDSVINLGNGFYFVSLEPITVAPGENPILLSIIISADGYQDKFFETYIAVDPDTLIKDTKKLTEEFPFVIIIAITSTVGGIGVAGSTFFLLRRRKRTSNIK